MRTLHLAAMPFPTQQGTQALIHAMLCALRAAGHDTHLCCYAQAGFERSTPYVVHRAREVMHAGSQRSGPSLRKLAQDAGMVADVARLAAALAPVSVFAHHVEAMAVALAAGLPDVTFVAHTSLSAELHTYFAAPLQRPLRVLGQWIDRALCRRARRVLSVSPMLAQRLSEECSREVTPLALPWCAHPALTAGERRAARLQLGLASDELVVGYVGNLDAYQGLAGLLTALGRAAREEPRLAFLVGTASDAGALRGLLPSGLRARVVPLTDDATRRALHAASDVIAVPRQSPGGIPIKLLDALAHGVPVVAQARALAGLGCAEVLTPVPDDDPAAFSAGLLTTLRSSPGERQVRGEAGRRWLEAHMSPRAFVDDLLGATRV